MAYRVTFEQARLLKEKGFDIKTTTFYASNGGVCDSVYDFDNWCYNPEQWQVVEWLRVNHDIWVSCYPTSNPLKCQFRIYKNDNGVMGQVYDDYMGKEFNSPQEAYSAAFDYILNNLI